MSIWSFMSPWALIAGAFALGWMCSAVLCYAIAKKEGRIRKEFQGTVAGVRAWRRALTATEVDGLYKGIYPDTELKEKT